LSPKLQRSGLITLVVCFAAFVSGALLSSEILMSRLPNHERYRCALCHSVSDPVTGNAPLNDFGTAFHENNDRWDEVLAGKDSDNDGVSNGIELGDDDGDGVPDVPEERSNPGNRLDKPSSVDERSWGIIKKLFSDPARSRF
jgi:hypothetical protein